MNRVVFKTAAAVVYWLLNDENWSEFQHVSETETRNVNQ